MAADFKPFGLFHRELKKTGILPLALELSMDAVDYLFTYLYCVVYLLGV